MVLKAGKQMMKRMMAVMLVMVITLVGVSGYSLVKIMIVNGEKGKEKVYFDPEEEMLQAMRRVAPSVVKVLPQYGR